jgi:hypothetical protein
VSGIIVCLHLLLSYYLNFIHVSVPIDLRSAVALRVIDRYQPVAFWHAGITFRILACESTGFSFHCFTFREPIFIGSLLANQLASLFPVSGLGWSRGFSYQRRLAGYSKMTLVHFSS